MTVTASLRSLRADLPWQGSWFVVFGVSATIVQVIIFTVLREWLGPLTANMIALILTTLLNTEAHRLVTFTRAVKTPGRLHAEGLATFVLCYVYTSGSLLLLDAWLAGPPSRMLEVVALLVSSGLGGVARFLLLRSWVFVRRPVHRTHEAIDE